MDHSIAIGPVWNDLSFRKASFSPPSHNSHLLEILEPKKLSFGALTFLLQLSCRLPWPDLTDLSVLVMKMKEARRGGVGARDLIHQHGGHER